MTYGEAEICLQYSFPVLVKGHEGRFKIDNIIKYSHSDMRDFRYSATVSPENLKGRSVFTIGLNAISIVSDMADLLATQVQLRLQNSVERLIRNELNSGKTQTAIVDRVRELCRKVKGANRNDPPVYEVPTLKQVQDYAREMGYTFDVKRFFNHYSATGWYTGSTQVRNWKALADGWNLSEPARQQEDRRLDKLRRPPSFDLEKLKERASSDDFYEEIV